jgi:hypothetical protein
MAFSAHDAATDAISRARALLAGSRNTRKSPSSLALEVREDMRRQAVVMAVAALDSYLHRLVVARVYDHGQLPKKLGRLSVEFELLLEQADLTAAAARSEPRNTRPRVQVKRILRERLLRMTFQSFDAVTDALNMAGKRSDWTGIGLQFTPTVSPNQIRARLDDVVRRRNQIVHEGDYERLDRPQRKRLNSLGYLDARSMVNFISELIDSINAAA